MDLHLCKDCEHYCSVCDDCCKGVPDHQDCMFNCWEPSRYHTLEQRYQQLAEVTRDMLDDLEDLPSGADDYRKKLEELGVEV